MKVSFKKEYVIDLSLFSLMWLRGELNNNWETHHFFKHTETATVKYANTEGKEKPYTAL